MKKNTKFWAALAGAVFLLSGTILFVGCSKNDASADGSKIVELPELSAKIDSERVRVSGFRDEGTGREYIIVQGNSGIAIVPRQNNSSARVFENEETPEQNDGILVPIDPRQQNGETMEEFMRRMQEFMNPRKMPR